MAALPIAAALSGETGEADGGDSNNRLCWLGCCCCAVSAGAKAPPPTPTRASSDGWFGISAGGIALLMPPCSAPVLAMLRLGTTPASESEIGSVGLLKKGATTEGGARAFDGDRDGVTPPAAAAAATARFVGVASPLEASHPMPPIPID